MGKIEFVNRVIATYDQSVLSHIDIYVGSLKNLLIF